MSNYYESPEDLFKEPCLCGCGQILSHWANRAYLRSKYNSYPHIMFERSLTLWWKGMSRFDLESHIEMAWTKSLLKKYCDGSVPHETCIQGYFCEDDFQPSKDFMASNLRARKS